MSLHYWALLFILSFVWGGSFFFIEVALNSVSPFTLVFLRVSIAAIILMGFTYAQKQYLPKRIKDWYYFFVMGLLNNALPFTLIVWGQTYITGSVASILNAMTPIFTILVAHLFTQDERLSFNKLTGVVLGFSGVMIMMLPTLEEGISWKSYGQLAVLGAALSYAFAGVWGKKLNYNSPMVNSTGMLICSSIIMLPTVLLIDFSNNNQVMITLPSALAVIALATISTAFAYGIYFKILSEAGATNISLVTLLVPVSAIFLGATLLNEVLQKQALIGMLVIFCGLIIIDGRLSKKLLNKVLAERQ
ncbi:MAG: DMT family transporter [Cellvibrionaceae bacterium]